MRNHVERPKTPGVPPPPPAPPSTAAARVQAAFYAKYPDLDRRNARVPLRYDVEPSLYWGWRVALHKGGHEYGHAWRPTLRSARRKGAAMARRWRGHRARALEKLALLRATHNELSTLDRLDGLGGQK